MCLLINILWFARAVTFGGSKWVAQKWGPKLKISWDPPAGKAILRPTSGQKATLSSISKQKHLKTPRWDVLCLYRTCFKNWASFMRFKHLKIENSGHWSKKSILLRWMLTVAFCSRHWSKDPYYWDGHYWVIKFFEDCQFEWLGRKTCLDLRKLCYSLIYSLL